MVGKKNSRNENRFRNVCVGVKGVIARLYALYGWEKKIQEMKIGLEMYVWV